MIIEGLVTTKTEEGVLHLAPMGAIVVEDFARLILRPFPSSTTFKNLHRETCGVFHITDNANLIARSAVGEPFDPPKACPAEMVNGFVLTDSCRAYEFRGDTVDTSGERSRIEVNVIHVHRQRDFLGFNRAKHAILEAAILATRFHLLNLDDVAEEFRKLQIIIDKTGTPDDDETMQMLKRKLAEAKTK
jgi:uncharacterized protein